MGRRQGAGGRGRGTGIDRRSPMPDPVRTAAGVARVGVYAAAEAGREYVIGCDPAEGNPQSDESAASVVDVLTGEQVAVLAGRFDPAVFAGYVASLSEYYHGAPALVERNNHGHAVLLWLAEFSQVACLPGLDGKPGWLESRALEAARPGCGGRRLRDGAWGGAGGRGSVPALAPNPWPL